MKQPQVSLAAELEHLAEVLESARIIAALLATGGLPDDDAMRRSPRMLEATVGIVISRIQLLRQVVIGSAEAALIVGGHNRARPRRPGDDPDVYLAGAFERRRR